MLKFLIVCPLVFVAGFIDAIAGGGGLISLPAYMIAGLPVHNSVATNKLSSCMGTTIATAKYAKSGFIPWKLAVFCVPCAFIGSAFGANIALMLDDGIFKIVMLVILPLTGIYVMTRKEFTPSGDSYSVKVTTVIAMAAALVVGIYDGFYGPGTGTFLILLLTGVARLKLDKANGLTKAINFSTNLSALVVYIINGQAMYTLGLVAGCFGILGNYLGAKRFEKGGTKLVKPVMTLVLTIFFIKVLTELIK